MNPPQYEHIEITFDLASSANMLKAPSRVP
jgi:hypothetical protein